MQGDSNTDRTGRAYFLVFIFFAILGGWVIWQGSQWKETADSRQVFPATSQGSENESIIFGRRGKITEVSKDSLIMKAKVEGMLKEISVESSRKTRAWNVVMDEDVRFKEVSWASLEEGQEIYAVAKDDINGKDRFKADRIYILFIDPAQSAGLPDIIGEGEVPF